MLRQRLPRVVAPVDDGQEFYYVQANITLEIDHSGTATLIRARHDVIDRHLLEIFHTYSLKDLRAAGNLPRFEKTSRTPLVGSFRKGTSTRSISPIGS